MEKVLIYPFDENAIIYIKHQKQLINMEIISLVSPKGWGLKGEEYSFNEKKFIVESDFMKCLNDCTAVWFIDTLLDLDFDYILKKILISVKKGKKIFYTRKSTYSEIEIIKKHVEFKFLYLEKIEDKYGEKYLENRTYNINVPVIFVAGESENTGKFDLQLSLKEEFTSRGYDVSLVASRQESRFWKMNSVPKYMLEHNLSERDKVIKFNHYIKDIEINENPELIIIGLPGGYLNLSRKLIWDFGILYYEIGNSVKPDCIILNLFYDNYDKESLTLINDEVKAVLGEDVDFFNITNRQLEVFESERDDVFTYLTLEEEFINNKILNINVKEVYQLNQKTEIVRIVENIIKKLSEYSYIKTI
ncbi:TPA: TIGR04066 family peptide maturation system protein [Clostridioides difficile]|uniref:TIGR04066 family peptide maturation system protein n=1 Tax=Clostridioides difficile TaxID=1496 RepID=UPI0010B2C8C7|nr:TIGR04066 family peptide maturation system protein [Clostridioides difficile]VHY39830.1 peptide maturation system protein, TIGR04066 family [Clostridioides difficile]